MTEQLSGTKIAPMGKDGVKAKPKKGARTILGLPKDDLGDELAAKLRAAAGNASGVGETLPKAAASVTFPSRGKKAPSSRKALPHNRLKRTSPPAKTNTATQRPPAPDSERPTAPPKAPPSPPPKSGKVPPTVPPKSGKAPPSPPPKSGKAASQTTKDADPELAKNESTAEIVQPVPVLDIAAATEDEKSIEDLASEDLSFPSVEGVKPFFADDEDSLDKTDLDPPKSGRTSEDGEVAGSVSSSPVGKLFPDDLEGNDGPDLPDSDIDDELSRPSDWAAPSAAVSGRKKGKPGIVVATKGKDDGLSTGWLFGAALAVGVGIGVAYFATQGGADVPEPVAQPVETAAEPAETAASEPEPRATTSAPAASTTPSATPSASASASASAAASGSSSAKKPPRVVRPWRRRRRPSGGNLEDIYE